jgi:hypothetical protein
MNNESDLMQTGSMIQILVHHRWISQNTTRLKKVKCVTSVKNAYMILKFWTCQIDREVPHQQQNLRKAK